MNWTLEVVVVPVSDVERAKEFYSERLGFNVDHDINNEPHGPRILQLTPPGSGCSIVVSDKMTTMTPGSLKGVQLVVNDLRAAHKELEKRGVGVSAVMVYGPNGLERARDDAELDNVGFVHFDDPDGNSWSIQQISDRP